MREQEKMDLLVRVVIVLSALLVFPLLGLLILAWYMRTFTSRDYYISVPPIPKNAGKGFQGKVFVIGAGTAGLFAGNTLKRLNVDFTILEASSTFGGRVQRHDSFASSVPLDLGAEWIHTDPDILRNLLVFENKEVDNIEVIPYHPQSFTFLAQNNQSYSLNFLRHFYVRDYKFKNTTWSQYLEKFVLPHVWDRIEYDACVTEIDYSGNDGVRIVLADGRTFSAEKVIVTVPLSVLKSGDIRFHPSLPNPKRAALHREPMTHAFKVFFEFQEKFYTDESYDEGWYKVFYENEDADDFVFFDALHRKDIQDRHVMGIFCHGARTKEFLGLTDEQIATSLLAKLDKIYDGKATTNYIKHIVKNWNTTPHIRGGYSFHPMDERDLREIIKPLDRKVYFAGEHVGGENSSTVAGAALTGRKAAVQAVSS